MEKLIDKGDEWEGLLKGELLKKTDGMLTRPFVIIGFSYLSGQLFAIYFGAGVAMIATMLGFCVFLSSLLVESTRCKRVIPIVLLSFISAVGIYSFSFCNCFDQVKRFIGKDAIISGTICELPYEAYGKHYYVVTADSIGNEDCAKPIKIRISSEEAIFADVYDRIKTRVRLFEPENKKGFSPKIRYASKGILMLGFLNDYENTTVTPGSERPLYYWALKCKTAMMQSIRILLPEKYASLADGILFGDKSGLDDQVKTAFTDSGIYHLFAVSGAHMAIIAQFLFLALKFLKIKKWAALGATIGIFGFMLITGFAPAVARSGIMSIIYMLGIFFNKKSDSLNSLGFAVFLLTALNPFAAGDIGFLLSVSATLGIILLSKHIEKFIFDKLKKYSKINSIIRCIISVSAVSIAAILFSLPISIFVFNKISLIAIITNILVYFSITILIICTLLASIFFFLKPFIFLAEICALIAGVSLNYITSCVDIVNKFPLATVPVNQPFVLIWFAGSLLILAIALIFYKNAHLMKAAGVLSSIILSCGILSYQLVNRNVIKLSVLDVGDGVSVILTNSKNAAVFSCGGDKFRARDYLSDFGVKNLDFMFLPGFSDNEARFAKRFSEICEPGCVILPKSKNDKEDLAVNVSNKNIHYFDSDVYVNFWGNISAKMQRKGGKVWTKIKVNDISILICPHNADAGEISSEYLTCDFVIFNKIPKNIDKIYSIYAILSENKEDYRDNLKKVLLSDKIPLTTAGDGAVQLEFKEKEKVCIRRCK
ncbi:MAG: ComEC/Rec2 family competence protein [Oscillospiraceae bacterium]|nr:ComEC/Rec2 family competence protein [Oscillospiraceae bacterium]